MLADLPAVVPLPSALVRLVVFNLPQNAFDASPPGGLVTIDASGSVDSLIIRVRDQGPGVPPELEARIFEPFFTTKTRDVRTGGMGIGLSLIQRSAAAVGGRVSVRNVVGGGAEFIVELPFEANEKASKG